MPPQQTSPNPQTSPTPCYSNHCHSNARAHGLSSGLSLALGAVLSLSLILLSLYPQPSHAVIEELVAADATLTDTGSEESAAADGSDSASANTDNTGENSPIETSSSPEQTRVNDQEIRQRITGIFSEIDGLQDLTVSVSQGVVTLSGDAPNEKKAQQAISLSNRLSDVVTVNDDINRTLAVEDNVTPVVKTLKDQAAAAIKAAPLMLMALLAFAVVAWFGRWLSRRKAIWQRITPNPFVAELLSQTVKVVFLVLGLILGLSLMGAEAIIGTLLGGAGVIGIAVGFAVKDTIENYIASLMLSIRQPFRARDQVVINGQEGIVVRLTSRATILMTLDGNQLRIPNSEVFKGTILNYTKNPERRFSFQLGVDANDDPLAAIKVGLDALNELDFVLTEPKAVAIITEVGDSNIVLEFQVWVNQTKTDFLKARSIAIREAKHAVENHGFSLPEPIYRLRFNADVENAITHFNQMYAPNAQSTADSTVGVTVTPTTPQPSPANTSASTSVTASDVEVTSSDLKEKQTAKTRAKQVLENTDVEAVMDAKPDTKLMEKVEEEIQEGEEKDLLNNKSPQE